MDVLGDRDRAARLPDASVIAVSPPLRRRQSIRTAYSQTTAEYPDSADPIHQALLAHRTWFYETVLAAFDRVTDRAPLAAAHFVMLLDGAMAEGCLGDADTVTATFLHGVDGMLASFDNTRK